MLMCCFCHNRFANVEELCAHIQFGGHGLNFRTFPCKQPNCQSSFSSFYSFKHHVTRAHANHQNDHLYMPNAEEQPQINIEVEIVDAEIVDADIDPEPLPDRVDGPDLTLPHFVNSFYSNIQMYIAQLYANPTTNRKLVDTILCSTGELFGSSIKLLKNSVFDLLSKCDSDDETYADLVGKVEQMFLVLENPFQDLNTEHKRFRDLENAGYFVKPESFEIGTVDTYEKVNDVIQLVKSPVYGQFVPIRKVLKVFLEIPGMFNKVMDHYNFLMNDQSGVVSNFVQGDLWKSIADDARICLPLHIEFDDYEPDNALGSHKTAHSLGALYVNIPCLTADMQSLLENMFLFCVFESKYRRQFGNRATFHLVIDELKHLQEAGILVDINGTVFRVYFYFSLIIGDNLGFHAIAGFMEGFEANFYCRVCKMHRDEMSCHCRTVPEHLLRTIENYEADVLLNDPPSTGIKERCIWNEVPSYHCLKNGSFDILHDIYEGMLKYDLCRVLYHLVHIRNYFTIDVLCERINSFDYGPSEIGNIIPTKNFNVDRLENCSVNLSASEMLCLGRYLGEIVGDLVPHSNRIWKFYLLVREIVDILMCPRFVPGVHVYLHTLIEEHHSLPSVRYFGDVKPKHHFMLHYSAALPRLGPLGPLSALLCERFHRRGKMYAKVCASRVNLPLSIALKLQLSLSERLMRTDSRTLLNTTKWSRQPGYSLLHFTEFSAAVPFQPNDVVTSVKTVEISGTLYSIGMIVVLNVANILPNFGKICHILVEDNDIHFIINSKQTECFLPHISAYEVTNSNEWVYLQQHNLVYPLPLWERKNVDGATVISVRHSL